MDLTSSLVVVYYDVVNYKYQYQININEHLGAIPCIKTVAVVVKDEETTETLCGIQRPYPDHEPARYQKEIREGSMGQLEGVETIF